MSLNAKLELRLFEVEQELSSLVETELRNLAAGKESLFFTRACGHWVAKEYSDDRVRNMERLRSESEMLRKKLGFEELAGPHALIDAYLRYFNDPSGSKGHAGSARIVLSERRPA